MFKNWIFRILNDELRIFNTSYIQPYSKESVLRIFCKTSRRSIKNKKKYKRKLEHVVRLATITTVPNRINWESSFYNADLGKRMLVSEYMETLSQYWPIVS